MDTPLKASESSVPGQCDLADLASRWISWQTFIDGSNASGKNEDRGFDIYVSHTYHSLRIPKRIAELTYLTFVKLGAVDTSDFSDPLTGSGLGNNDSDDREALASDVEFPVRYTSTSREGKDSI